MLIIPDLVRKFNVFLKDETVAATLEYLALSAGIAVAVLTAFKTTNPSPACRNCGRPLRFVRAISKFYLHPELRIYECDQCRRTVVEEWRSHENATGQLPNSPYGARTVTAGLMVLRKKGGMSNLDVAIMFGIWAGSIVFGWKQQSLWLVVPTVVCAAYIALLICHDKAWAAKGFSLARRKILERHSSWLRSPWTLRCVEKSLSLFWAAAGKAANNSKAAITFRASLEKLEDRHFDVPVCGAEDGNAENVDAARLIAQAQSHHAKTDLSVTSTALHSEKASVEEDVPHATDITTFASSSQQDSVVGTAFPLPTHFGDSSAERCARPQDASDADKGFALGELGFDCEYFHSSNHQTTTLSSDDAAELKLSPSAEAQKDMDRVPFPGEPEPLEGKSSGSTQHSSTPVEMAPDNHREGNSGAGGGIETNNTSWDMARILLGVSKDVEKNSSST